MSVEEGAKMIVSVGMVVPEHISADEVEEIVSKIPSPTPDRNDDQAPLIG